MKPLYALASLTRNLAIMLALIGVIAQTSIAQHNSENTTLVGQWGRGPYCAVDAQGDIAYFGCGANLRVFDYSEPENPEELSELSFPAVICEIIVSGNYAYMYVYRSGLYIVDVSDPANLSIESCYEVLANEHIYLSDGLVYLACGPEGLQIIDVSDPSSPEEITVYEIEDAHVEDVAVEDTWAYLILNENNPGLMVLDVSDPHHPSEAGFFRIDVQARHGLFCTEVRDGLALVGALNNGLFIIDAADPENMELTSQVGLNIGDPKDILLYGNYVYTASSNDNRGIFVTDISDPYNPVNVFCGPDSLGSMNEVALGNDIIYTIKSTGRLSGRYAYDVSEPDNPEFISHFNDSGWIFTVEISGNYAYINEGCNFTVLDISDLTNPVSIGSLQLQTGTGVASVLTIHDNYIYLLDVHHDLLIIDVFDPHNPIVRGVFDNQNGSPEDIAIVGNRAYLATSNNITTIDISDLSNPIEIGAIHAPSSIGIDASGDCIFVAGYLGYLWVFDISDPDTIEIIAEIELGSRGSDVKIFGQYAYVACLSGGILVFDVSDPYHPEEVGSYIGDDFYPCIIKVTNNYIYVADWYFGLWILNIEEPTHPSLSGYYETFNLAMDVAVSGNCGFIADRYDGLFIIRNDDEQDISDDFRVNSSIPMFSMYNYPNPFNKETTISYYLPYSSRISAKIYNMNGVEIRRLIDGHISAGNHSIIWNAREIPSGSFIISLDLGEQTFFRKVTLIK